MSAEEGADQWALMKLDGGNRIADKLIGYTFERARHADRWHGAVRDWPKPLSFAWGLQDPVATTHVLDGLRELAPGRPRHRAPRPRPLPPGRRPRGLPRRPFAAPFQSR